MVQHDVICYLDPAMLGWFLGSASSSNWTWGWHRQGNVLLLCYFLSSFWKKQSRHLLQCKVIKIRMRAYLNNWKLTIWGVWRVRSTEKGGNGWLHFWFSSLEAKKILCKVREVMWIMLMFLWETKVHLLKNEYKGSISSGLKWIRETCVLVFDLCWCCLNQRAYIVDMGNAYGRENCKNAEGMCACAHRLICVVFPSKAQRKCLSLKWVLVLPCTQKNYLAKMESEMVKTCQTTSLHVRL